MIIQKHQNLYGNILEMNQLIITDSNFFKFKSRFLNNTDDTGTVDVESIVLLKYLNNFW